VSTQITFDEKGMGTFFDMIVNDTIDYCEDGKSVIEDLTPIGVTGDMMRAWETAYDIDQDAMTIHGRISNNNSNVLYQEMGTDPFKAKLVPIRLSRQQQKILKDIGGRLHMGRGGEILAPVWFKEWGPKVRKGPPRDRWSKDPWRSPAVNYKKSWDLWFKIAKKGISAKHFAHRGVEIMKTRKSLYPLAASTGARIEVGR
jgi:hypothetical protein